MVRLAAAYGSPRIHCLWAFIRFDSSRMSTEANDLHFVPRSMNTRRDQKGISKKSFVWSWTSTPNLPYTIKNTNLKIIIASINSDNWIVISRLEGMIRKITTSVVSRKQRFTTSTNRTNCQVRQIGQWSEGSIVHCLFHLTYLEIYSYLIFFYYSFYFFYYFTVTSIKSDKFMMSNRHSRIWFLSSFESMLSKTNKERLTLFFEPDSLFDMTW